MEKKTLMENLAREAHEKGVFNGTWLYGENGEIISKGALGFRDAEDKLPMQENSILDLASVSKQFTAAAIMLLRKRGLLRLEDELTEFFPGLPLPGVTIYHLLTHTGGVPDPADVNYYVKEWELENKVAPNSVVLRYLAESGAEPYFAPGDEWNYSNAGYNLLALIIEKVSGLRFAAFMRENIFEPCGMHATGVYHIRVDGIPSVNFARSMVLEHDRFVLPEESEHERDVIAADGQEGDGNVYSTISDLFAWDRALRREALLSREEQKLMYTPVKLNNGETFVDDQGAGYGFGWEIRNDGKLGLIAAHSGWHKGATSWYERFVDADRVLVMLWSRDAEDDIAYSAFMEGMRAIAMDREPEPLRTIEEIAAEDPDRSEWESCCGKYAHEEGDTFYPDEVYRRDGALYVRFVQAVRGELEARLYPFGEHEFGMKHFSFTLRLENGTLTMFDEVYRKL